MRLGKMKIERAKKDYPVFAKNWEIRNKAFESCCYLSLIMKVLPFMNLY